MREDEELVVVWSGAMELLPPRPQHPDPTWEAPKSQVNKNRKPYNPSAVEGQRKGEDND